MAPLLAFPQAAASAQQTSTVQYHCSKNMFLFIIIYIYMGLGFLLYSSRHSAQSLINNMAVSMTAEVCTAPTVYCRLPRSFEIHHLAGVVRKQLRPQHVQLPQLPKRRAGKCDLGFRYSLYLLRSGEWATRDWGMRGAGDSGALPSAIYRRPAICWDSRYCSKRHNQLYSRTLHR